MKKVEIPTKARSPNRRHRCRGLTCVVALAFLSGLSLRAQFGPLLSPSQAPQAKSQEELDAYLRIVTSSNPQDTVQDVDKFAAEYPQSALLGIAFEYQMLAYERLNDFKGVLKAGHRALQLEPKNVNTLLTLAYAISNSVNRQPDRAELLNEAANYAQLALKTLPGMRIPRQIPMDRWDVMRGELESQAHEALGNLAIKEGNLQTAIAEFKTAVSTNPTPIGRQFYRLGVAYAMAEEAGPAKKALSRAVDLGPDAIRKLASNLLQHLGKSQPKAQQEADQ